MTKLKMLAILLVSIVLAPGAASALTKDQGYKICEKYGGHMVWNWDIPTCPWCNTTCTRCWTPRYVW